MHPCSARPRSAVRRARRRLVPLLAGASLLAAAGTADARSSGPVFEPPVRLTPVEGLGGFEPSLTLDRSGNVWVTAHETYSPVSVAPDDHSPARGASWLWLSKDGVTFKSPGGLTPANEYQQFAGSEGDIAVDGKGNVYFVDLGALGVALTSWKVNGPADVTATYTTPQLPLPLLATDRPFIAAGGNGTLLLTQQDATGFRSYVSVDGGRSFENLMPDSIKNGEWCRPLIDRRDSDRMVLLCLPASGRDLLSLVSTDSGRTWTPHAIAGAVRDSHGSNVVMPSLQQASDGSLVGLYHRFQGGGFPDSVDLVLLRSRDMGRTWTTSEVTPEAGIWEDSSVAVAPDGTLAVSGYYRKNKKSPWGFRAATFRPGARDIVSVPVGPTDAYAASETDIGGEFTQAAFGSDGKLRVTYAVRELRQLQAVSDADEKHLISTTVFYAQQR